MEEVKKGVSMWSTVAQSHLTSLSFKLPYTRLYARVVVVVSWALWRVVNLRRMPFWRERESECERVYVRDFSWERLPDFCDRERERKSYFFFLTLYCGDSMLYYILLLRCMKFFSTSALLRIVYRWKMKLTKTRFGLRLFRFFFFFRSQFTFLIVKLDDSHFFFFFMRVFFSVIA